MTALPSSSSRSDLRPRSSWTEAEWYDHSIDWSARLAREIPVLRDVFGSPGSGGLVDAGCGTGHQAAELARHGYRAIGVDISEEMLSVARRTAEGTSVEFIAAPYSSLPGVVGRSVDGIYCLANSLAAAGTRESVRTAVARFSECVRPGGRVFIQVLNFAPMRKETPCLRGPRVTQVDGCPYVSVRQFSFFADHVMVTNITIWNESGWHHRGGSRRLYPVSRDELTSWMETSGLRVDELWGGYDRQAFDERTSTDLIIVGTRVQEHV